jgi:pyruvate formate lyase activating enzyme
MVNDNEDEIGAIKKFLYSCGTPEKIELLPYHAMGEHKYAAIGKEAQFFSTPSEEKIRQLKNIFS